MYKMDNDIVQIEGSSYYIVSKDQVTSKLLANFYTNDGCFIKGINACDETDNIQSYRLNRMLDPNYEDIVRPHKLVYCKDDKSKYVKILDKHNNTIFTKEYSGDPGIFDFLTYEINEDEKPLYRLDYSWMIDNDIIFVNSCKPITRRNPPSIIETVQTINRAAQSCVIQ